MALVLALGAADVRFEEIVSQVGVVSHAQTLVQLEAFERAHAGEPEVGRALLLEAQLRQADGDLGSARTVLDRALALGSNEPWASDAALARAQLDAEAWRFGPAIAAFDALAQTATGRWRYQAELGATLAREARMRLWLAVGIAAVLIAVSGARLVLARFSWSPMPEEVVYALPVTVLLVAAATSQPAAEARAVVMLALGGLVLLWVNATFHRSRQSRGGWRVFELIFSASEAVGLLYCAIISNNLWNRFVETLATGAD